MGVILVDEMEVCSFPLFAGACYLTIYDVRLLTVSMKINIMYVVGTIPRGDVLGFGLGGVAAMLAATLAEPEDATMEAQVGGGGRGPNQARRYRN